MPFFLVHSLDGEGLDVESMEEAVVARGGTRCLRPHHLKHGAQHVLETFP